MNRCKWVQRVEGWNLFLSSLLTYNRLESISFRLSFVSVLLGSFGFCTTCLSFVSTHFVCFYPKTSLQHDTRAQIADYCCVRVWRKQPPFENTGSCQQRLNRGSAKSAPCVVDLCFLCVIKKKTFLSESDRVNLCTTMTANHVVDYVVIIASYSYCNT